MREAKQIFNEWVENVNNSDIKSLLKLYDRDAILIPTFSNSILNTSGMLQEYFENLGSRENLSITIDKESLITQELENNIFSLSGIYFWHFKVNGVMQKFEARFSYLFDFSKANPILHHHSSLIPEKLKNSMNK